MFANRLEDAGAGGGLEAAFDCRIVDRVGFLERLLDDLQLLGEFPAAPANSMMAKNRHSLGPTQPAIKGL